MRKRIGPRHKYNSPEDILLKLTEEVDRVVRTVPRAYSFKVSDLVRVQSVEDISPVSKFSVTYKGEERSKGYYQIRSWSGAAYWIHGDYLKKTTKD